MYTYNRLRFMAVCVLSKHVYVLFSLHVSFDVLTQAAALSWKLCHVKDKEVTKFIALRDKGGKETKL
jgi:hypothetical protein